MPDVHNTADRSRRQRHYKRTSGNALGRSNSVIASGAISSLFKQPTPPPEGSGRIWLAVKRAQCMLRNPQLVVPAKKALPDARTRIEGPCQTIGINTIAQIAKRPPTRIFPCDAFKNRAGESPAPAAIRQDGSRTPLRREMPERRATKGPYRRGALDSATILPGAAGSLPSTKDQDPPQGYIWAGARSKNEGCRF